MFNLEAVVLVEYVAVQRIGWTSFSQNPRFMFPIAGLLATLLSFILFDPIRSWDPLSHSSLSLPFLIFIYKIVIERKMNKLFRAPTNLSNLMSFGVKCKLAEEDKLRTHLFGPPLSVTVIAPLKDRRTKETEKEKKRKKKQNEQKERTYISFRNERVNWYALCCTEERT
jgi:hypothetical protein